MRKAHKKIGDYVLLKKLGEGNFGSVYLTKNEVTKEEFATKTIPKKSPFLSILLREIDSLKECNHKNVVKFYDTLEDDDNFYVVMEFCNGGDLRKALSDYKKKYKKHFPEETVILLSRQLAEAFNHLHEKKIIHRDLKPDNIMLSYTKEGVVNSLDFDNIQIKIVDFGLSRTLNTDERAQTIAGTPETTPPEILEAMISKSEVKGGGYSFKVDVWSFGCVVYQMFVGEVPFSGVIDEQIQIKHKLGVYHISSLLNPSLECLDFLSGILQIEPEIRMNWKQILSHPFLSTPSSNFTRLKKLDRPKMLALSAKSEEVSNDIVALYEINSSFENLKKHNLSFLFPKVPATTLEEKSIFFRTLGAKIQEQTKITEEDCEDESNSDQELIELKKSFLERKESNKMLDRKDFLVNEFVHKFSNNESIKNDYIGKNLLAYGDPKAMKNDVCTANKDSNIIDYFKKNFTDFTSETILRELEPSFLFRECYPNSFQNINDLDA